MAAESHDSPFISLDDHHIGDTAFNVRKTVDYPVGSGGYSNVYKAQLTRGGVTLPVALKVILRSDSPERLRKREEREHIWILLSHQNIAPLNAIYRQTDGLLVFVSPWYENGTADVYLRTNPAVNPMGIVCEISSAVEYLHGRGIVHGDLKGSNIMIDDSGHVKLIDSGLSRFSESHTALTTSTHTTLRWCAPELLDSDDPRPTKPSDVYSFASTVLELLTGQFPYNKIRGRLAIYARILLKENPRHSTSEFRYHIPRSQELWLLMEQCWAEPSERPIIHDVTLSLQVFIN